LEDNAELTNVVSKKHSQVSLKDISDVVREVAQQNGFNIKEIKPSDTSYLMRLNSHSGAIMDNNIDIHLGRNDSKGRAAITINGSGNIFVCSNMIIAHIDRHVTKNAKDLGIDLPKIKPMHLIHTTKLDERFRESLASQILHAKEFSIILGRKLEEAKSIKMSRASQLEAIRKVVEFKKLSKAWHTALQMQLNAEDMKEPEYAETLYQLSQVFTFVGTHVQAGSESQKQLFCKIGGQIVILGADFVNLMQKKEKVIEVKVI